MPLTNFDNLLIPAGVILLVYFMSSGSKDDDEDDYAIYGDDPKFWMKQDSNELRSHFHIF